MTVMVVVFWNWEISSKQDFFHFIAERGGPGP
jgi:hypothetical protein